MKRKVIQFISTVLFVIFIISCTSKLTRSNFERIQPGMSLNEVIAILGEPNSSSALSVGVATGMSARWENRNGIVVIQFFNDRVRVKHFIKGVSTSRKEI